jgi:hypothetical protein
MVVLCQLNSKVFSELIKIINPTVHFHIGYFNKLPFCIGKGASEIASEAVEIARNDWHDAETSWDFTEFPAIRHGAISLALSQHAADLERLERLRRLNVLEERNNRILIDAYQLGELSPEVQWRAATGHDPPLPRRRVLQASPVDVQEAANLLALLQR